MSNGSYHSSSGRHPSRHYQRGDHPDIEQNLLELGLIGTRRKTAQKTAKAKPKTVEFGSPVVQHSTDTQFILSPCFHAQTHSCLF